MGRHLGTKFGPDAIFRNEVQLVLSLSQFWIGYDIFVGGFNSFKQCAFTMDTLVTLGTLTAFIFSAFVTIFPSLYP